MATNFVWRGGGWADVGLCPYLVMITVVVVVVASATAAAACLAVSAIIVLAYVSFGYVFYL